ncbi:MAG: hypothetical protein C4324_10895 [Blastocatellia bacterium]
MKFDQESAVEAAIVDLAARLGISATDVRTVAVIDRDFPDLSLGAAAPGEMAAQMIATGWEIRLEAGGREYEYRADKYQLRLVGFKGQNNIIRG